MKSTAVLVWVLIGCFVALWLLGIVMISAGILILSGSIQLRDSTWIVSAGLLCAVGDYIVVQITPTLRTLRSTVRRALE